MNKKYGIYNKQDNTFYSGSFWANSRRIHDMARHFSTDINKVRIIDGLSTAKRNLTIMRNQASKLRNAYTQEVNIEFAKNLCLIEIDFVAGSLIGELSDV